MLSVFGGPASAFEILIRARELGAHIHVLVPETVRVLRPS